MVKYHQSISNKKSPFTCTHLRPRGVFFLRVPIVVFVVVVIAELRFEETFAAVACLSLGSLRRRAQGLFVE